MKRAAVGVLIATVAVCGAGAYLLFAPHSLRVRRVTSSDPALQAAVRKAQETLPEFLTALRLPKEGQRFAFCGRFPTSGEPEYLWVRDPIVMGGSLKGRLDQAPFARPDLHKGDAVTVARADVVDWLIREPDGTQRGGTTLRVLQP